jgi:hypothetical protein
MPRSFAILLACGLLILSSLALATGARAATIAPTTTCSNNTPNTAGLGVICEVTVVNTITAIGGTATVTVRECHGAANDAEADCVTTTEVLSEPVTAVTQCNDILAGGSTLECSVDVTNNFVGFDPSPTAATVNQCVGSSQGGGIQLICDPVQSTTSATITQCNGSGNGGGLVAGSTCTATGTQSAALAVTINQCNGSANGGGAFIVCSANIENNQVAGAPTATPTTTPAGGATPPAGSTPRVTPPTTDTTTGVETQGSASLQIALLAISVIALLVLVATLRPAGSIRRR